MRHRPIVKLIIVGFCFLQMLMPLVSFSQIKTPYALDERDGAKPSFGNKVGLNQTTLGSSVIDSRLSDSSGKDLLGGSGLGGMGGLLGVGQGNQVHILGQVKTPGVYRLPSSTRLTEALKVSGGLNSKGSERFIELRRGSEGRTYLIDLYQYSTNGVVANNPFLVENDVVYVPMKKKVVQVEGSVNRTGEFEIKDENNLYQVIKSIGGFTVGASHLEPLRVVRYDEHERKHIFEVERQTEEMQQFGMRNGDVVVANNLIVKDKRFDYNIKSLPNDNMFYPSYEERIFVVGALNQPGPYAFNPYYKLSDYITVAGGKRIDGKGFAYLVNRDGVKKRYATTKFDEVDVQPGDTIMVPEKRFDEKYIISLVTGLASLGLTSYAILK